MCVLKPIDCATTSMLDKTTFAGFLETKRVWYFIESWQGGKKSERLHQWSNHVVVKLQSKINEGNLTNPTWPRSNSVARFNPWDRIIKSNALRISGPVSSFPHGSLALCSYTNHTIQMSRKKTWILHQSSEQRHLRVLPPPMTKISIQCT